jgi:hypothetical protein
MRQTVECIASLRSCCVPTSTFAGRFFSFHSEKKSNKDSLSARHRHHECLLPGKMHYTADKQHLGFPRAVEVDRLPRMYSLPIDVKQQHAQCTPLCTASSERSSLHARQHVRMMHGRAWIDSSGHLHKNADSEKNADRKHMDAEEGSRQLTGANQDEFPGAERASVKDTRTSVRDPSRFRVGAKEGFDEHEKSMMRASSSSDNTDDVMMMHEKRSASGQHVEQAFDDHKQRDHDYDEFMPGGMDDRIEDLFSSKLSDSRRAEKWTKSYACPTCTLRWVDFVTFF